MVPSIGFFTVSLIAVVALIEVIARPIIINRFLIGDRVLFELQSVITKFIETSSGGWGWGGEVGVGVERTREVMYQERKTVDTIKTAVKLTAHTRCHSMTGLDFKDSLI